MTSSTFNPASLPDLSYIVPNECDDMHTLPANGAACPAFFGSNPGTSVINIGDNWLATVVKSLLAQPNVTVLITWDEGRVGSQIPTLEVGAGVTAGSTDGAAYNHYNLEAGLYHYFGLGTAPSNGAAATPLPIPAPGKAPAPTVTASTPVTLGASAPTADRKDWASYEVRPSGGSTPSRDASAPAIVTSASNAVTTASFTPPSGAVLVALGTTNLWSSSAPTISDSSGLTWTRRAWFAGGGGMTALFTATVP